MSRMIVLFTDFGADDIYVAQVKAVLLQAAPPGTPIVDLLHRVPDFDVRAGAHLLAALSTRFPAGTVFLAVVDPGVGSEREAVVVEADGRFFVGPDNGLLSVVSARAGEARIRRIVWRPASFSASFHGRDLFAPIAAEIAGGQAPATHFEFTARLDVQFGAGDLAQVIYVDHYGNLLSGLRAQGAKQSVSRQSIIEAGGQRIAWARAFADAPAHQPFWYENSVGLLEIAVPRGRAATLLGLDVGAAVRLIAG